MTTTEPSPITLETSCPAWCTEHIWAYMDEQDPVRVRHEAPVTLTFAPDAKLPKLPRRISVTPELYVRADGTTEPMVYLDNQLDGILTSAEEVGQLVAALLRAAAQVFGDDAADALAAGMLRPAREGQ